MARDRYNKTRDELTPDEWRKCRRWIALSIWETKQLNAGGG